MLYSIKSPEKGLGCKIDIKTAGAHFTALAAGG
jgi:hypothetical protein